MKDLKSKCEMNIKSTEIWIIVMNSWETILEFDWEERYLYSFHLLKFECAKFPNFMECMEGKIMGMVKEKMIRA